MQKQLTVKLNSKCGASLSLALLLFLVCAVLGSVVLVAATAAAGRLSDMQTADQRYFSVQSAAHLLIDELDGQSYTMTREKHEELTITTQLITDSSGNVVSTNKSENSVFSFYTLFDENGVTKADAGISRSDSILAEAFLDYAFGLSQTDFSNATAWAEDFPALDSPMTKSFSMQIDAPAGSDLDTSLLTVDITMTLNTDASVTFNITNGGSSPYTVQLKFTAARSDNKNSPDVTRSEGGSTFDSRTNSFIETKTIDSARTTKISWKLTEMR